MVKSDGCAGPPEILNATCNVPVATEAASIGAVTVEDDVPALVEVVAVVEVTVAAVTAPPIFFS